MILDYTYQETEQKDDKKGDAEQHDEKGLNPAPKV